MVTLDTVVVGVPPSISKELFVHILAPTTIANDAAASYDTIIKRNVDPILCLAIAHHESNYGALGICHDYNTRSPGNTRSTRTGKGTVIQTRGGPFCRYGSWVDGFDDAAFRLTDPTFVYAQEGRTTITQIIARWAPQDDGNDPGGYANSIVKDMNTWIAQEKAALVAADDPKAIWQPSSNFDTGRNGYAVDHITCHMTAGTSSLSWLRGKAAGSSNTASSATYLIERDGTIYQLVREADTAWADGNLAYNNSGISIEHEAEEGEGFTDAQIHATIGLQARIAQRHGWKSVTHPTATVLPEAGTPGKSDIIGHSQVPSPSNAAQGGGVDAHVGCPGPLFPWQTVIDGVNAILAGKPPQVTQQPAPVPANQTNANGHKIVLGFNTYFSEFVKAGRQLQLRAVGNPLTNEFTYQFSDNPSQNYSVQLFERAGYQWESGNTDPWDLHSLTVPLLIELYLHAIESGLIADNRTPLLKKRLFTEVELSERGMAV